MVAQAIFKERICHFCCPVEITSDNGKEFCIEFTEELIRPIISILFLTMGLLRFLDYFPIAAPAPPPPLAVHPSL
jgi:hypothetical protein